MTKTPTAPRDRRLQYSPSAHGIFTLALLCIASGFFVYAYLSGKHVPVSPAGPVAVSTIHAFDDLTLEAKSAIVVDLKTGRVLYEKDADERLPLASITKVALTLAVSEVLPGNSMITIPYDTAPSGSSERLGAGEVWQVQKVIDFTLVSSSNQGADILAAAADSAIHAKYPASPAEGATIWRMNDLARELGLAKTSFQNDNGLDLDVEGGISGAYSSARDVARLFAYAASTTPETFAATAKDGLTLADQDGNTTNAVNTNEALGAIPGLVFGKTGYTDLAGGNLAVLFDDGLSHPVVAVVLGSSIDGRFSDMKKLVKAAREAVAEE